MASFRETELSADVQSRSQRLLSSVRPSDIAVELNTEDDTTFAGWISLHSSKGDILNLKESNITEPNAIGCKIFTLQDLLTVFSSNKAVHRQAPDVECRESIEIEDVKDINGSVFYFLTQWSKLWNFLSTKNMYSVASKCQLFHFSVEIVFRSSFLFFLSCLSLYYSFSQLLLLVFYRGEDSFPAIIILVLLAASIMVAHVIRGSLLDGNSATQFVHEQRRDEMLFENTITKDLNDEKTNIKISGYMSFISRSDIFVVLKQFLKHLLSFRNYIDTTLHHRQSSSWQNFKELTDLDGYYHLLELGTRYADINDPNGSKGKTVFVQIEKVVRGIFVVFPSLGVYAFIRRMVYTIKCYYDYDDEIDWCEAFLWRTYLSGFWLIPLFVEVSLYLIISIGLVSLWYGSIIAHALSDNWIMRYASLRRVSASNEGNIEGLHYNHLIDFIKRDAFERYLFVQHFFFYISQLWSWILFTAITLTIIVMVYIYLLSLWYYAEFNTVNELLAIAFFFDAFILFCIISIVMYANSSVDVIRRRLINSSKDDYKLIGSREDWINFVDEAPCYWYIFGFAITRSWMFGFIGGAISALLGALVLAKLE